MREYLPGLLLGGLFCGCGGDVTKEPGPQTTVQHESSDGPQVGDPSEIEDPGGKTIDTCCPTRRPSLLPGGTVVLRILYRWPRCLRVMASWLSCLLGRL